MEIEGSERGSAVERLVATGRVVPARLDLVTLALPPVRSGTMPISEALAEQRRER